MPFNKAIIPLYLNTDMLNNLFTIVIQEFVETKSIGTKDVLNVHLKTPLSELSYDLFGKYMQGEIDIQIQNEFVKQRTEERISATIVILKKLKDLLASQGLLKILIDTNKNSNIEVNDYVEFSCKLNRNPYIENLMNTINLLEIQGTIDAPPNEISADGVNEYGGQLNSLKRKELLDYLKTSLSDHKRERCIRYIANNVNGSMSAVVPVKMGSLLDHEDYMLSGNVTIFGKVIKIIEEGETTNTEGFDNEKYEYLITNDAFFDNIDYDRLHNVNCPFLRRKPQTRKINNVAASMPKFEILPIAIYI
ncbi:DUF6414 family protein [Clostridium thermarum]|nr:hypothetical protein [Clostridium thermarum]